MDEKRKKVFEFLSWYFSDWLKEGETLSEKTSLRDDLGVDSLDAVELIIECEGRFHIDISDEAAEKVETVGDIIDGICACLK